MKLFFRQHQRLLFYAAWIVLGLLQSGLTELQDDEAYYWVYSKYLDTGYFDHPPMIAVLVKMGYAIFPNELGVRLFPLLLNVLSLVIIEKLLNYKNDLLFYAITLSIAALQLACFIAVPDIPLIFFTALFFFCYKKFAVKQSLSNSLLLAVSIALLFYTKYHAVLIVLFTLLSNIKLFAKPQLYLSGFIALVLFAPHLFWQWEHNWISFRYHLFESNVNTYKFSFTTDYLAGQILIAGPIAGFILLPAAFLYKTRSATEKAMKWTITGIYIFFFLSSFRGKVEANWTSPALVLLIVLSHQYLNEKLNWQKWLLRLLPVTLLLVMCMRVFMIVDILPIEGEMIGKPVYFLDIYRLNRFTDSLKTPIGYVGYRYDSSFISFASYNISTGNRYKAINQNDSLVLYCSNYMNRYHNLYIKKNPGTLYSSTLIFFEQGKIIKTIPFSLQLEKMGTKNPEPFSVYPDLPKGKYHFIISIKVPGYNATHNSENIELIVE